jgi:hypothetical protein
MTQNERANLAYALGLLPIVTTAEVSMLVCTTQEGTNRSRRMARNQQERFARALVDFIADKAFTEEAKDGEK